MAFIIRDTDSETGIRTGRLETAHGTVTTPAFVPVGTQASVKSLDPRDLEDLKIELFFVNTYHAYLRPGPEVVEKHGGLHDFMAWNRSIITDSGGFQVFSLGSKRYINIALSETAVLDRERFTAKKSRKESLSNLVFPDEYRPVGELVAIDDDGVTFTSHLDGTKHRFTPEFSVTVQDRLGTDIMIAFDECAPYPVSYEYAKEAMDRSHNWLDRSMTEYRRRIFGTSENKRKLFYGVVQGSTFSDLRQISAGYVSGKNPDGIAIGGVSVGEGKAEMKSVLDAVCPNLDPAKPRHLLGVGEIDDIFTILEHGIDTFDCVQPTRLARMGELFIHPLSFAQAGKIFPVRKGFRFPVFHAAYRQDPDKPDPHCGCYTCLKFSRSYLHHLFRSRELLGYRLASIHNIYIMKQFVDICIREAEKGRYRKLKKTILGSLF